MRLSILLPTHNRADVLGFAIESVLAQSFADFELLVVGDGCSDATAEVVGAFAARDGRVRWFDLPKAPGFGYENRNVALRQARGELVGFMAHDDLVAPEHFQMLVELMEDRDVHLGHTSAMWVGQSGRMVPTVFHLEDAGMRQGLLERVWNRLPATCFIHRRAAFESVGMWDGTLAKGGDMDLWSRIIGQYGAQSVRGLGEFTAFHFRADWRTLDLITPDNEPAWLGLHEAPGRLDPLLRVVVPAGCSEQEAYWQWLCAHPGAAAMIRKAVLHALMTHAWDLEKTALGNAAYIGRLQETIGSLLPPEAIAAAEARSDALLREREALAAERDGLRAERDGLRAERDGLRAERDALRGERDALAQKGDTLKADKLRLKERVQRLKAEAAERRARRWWKRLF